MRHFVNTFFGKTCAVNMIERRENASPRVRVMRTTRASKGTSRGRIVAIGATQHPLDGSEAGYNAIASARQCSARP